MSYAGHSYGSITYGNSAALGIDLIPRSFSVDPLEIVLELGTVTITGGANVIAPTYLDIEVVLISPTVETYTPHYPEHDIEIETEVGYLINRDAYRSVDIEIDNELLNPSQNAIMERAIPWWEDLWIYRRYVTIPAPPTGLEKNHPILFALDKEAIYQNKVREDYEDIQVLKLISRYPEKWKILSHTIEENTKYLNIKFPLDVALDVNETSVDEYFVYYGNKSLANDPIIWEYSYNEYPIIVLPNDPTIGYTHPGLDWGSGESDARDAKAYFSFYGSRIKLYADTGPSWGKMHVQLDANPVEIVDLFSPSEQTGTAVWEATGLADVPHYLRIIVAGQKNGSSTSTRVNFRYIAYSKHGTTIDDGEEANPTLMWSANTGGK